MDYTYFGAPQQPYNQFPGMSQPSFAHTGLDADTTRSIVSVLFQSAMGAYRRRRRLRRLPAIQS